MSQNVTVKFDPPRTVLDRGARYNFGEGLWLPTSKVKLQSNEVGKVVAAEMPEWLARDRGLIGHLTETAPTMSREDCFLLGITMAMLIRDKADGRTQVQRDHTAVFDAKCVVRKMLEEGA